MRFLPSKDASACLLLAFVFAGTAAAQSGETSAPQSRNLAPGFRTLPKARKIALMPTDIELFSISGGGIAEPKADWTESASKFFRSALIAKKDALGLTAVE